MRQGSDPNVELDCFLEIEGVYTPFAEEIAGAVAEEIEAWVAGDAPVDRREAEAALSVAKQLRVLGWLIGGELGDNPAASRERFEVLIHQVGEILLPPAARDGGSAEPKSRRHFSSAMILATQSLYDLESEDTVVKRAAWERNTNRALPGSDHPPPPSGRVAPSYPPLRASSVIPSVPAEGLGRSRSDAPGSSKTGS